MDLHILADTHIRLDTASPDEGLVVDGTPFGPLQMLATSLALCTASTIQSYADTAKLDVAGLAIEVRWEYADDPYRVGTFEIVLHLPEHLPEARRRAIARASATCTVHQTLHHGASVTTTVRAFDPTAHVHAPPNHSHEAAHADQA